MAAASDLQTVLPVLAERFTAIGGAKINPVFGASGQLAEQVRHGAPYDLFLSANVRFVRDLTTEGLVQPDSLRVYARGRLVLVTLRGAKIQVRTLADLSQSEIKHIAIANPDFAPYGLAARESLERSGLWESLKPKVVKAETVRQALQYVQAGNADVGLVAHSVARDADVRAVDVDQGLYEPILQGLGIVKSTKFGGEAQSFADFVLGAEGQKTLASFGFGPPR